MSEIKTEMIQDFSGGMNTRFAVNRINPNESGDCINVFADNKALTKRPCWTGQTAFTVNGNSLTGQIFVPIETASALFGSSSTDTLFLVGVGQSDNYPQLWWTQDGSSIFPVGESTGTVTYNSGSAIVTGSGTSWTTTVRAGDQIKVNGISTNFVISSVDSDTQITLNRNAASSAAGTTYQTYVCFDALTTLAKIRTARIRLFFLNSKLYAVPSYAAAATSVARSWDGTHSGNVTAMPAVKYVNVFKNYVFGANTSANPSRVSWSALKDATTWPATSFVDVAPDDGNPIVGMFADNFSLIVLKRHSAFRLSGDEFDPSNPTYTLTQISTPPDFYADNSRSAAFFNGAWVFKGPFGLYQWDGSSISKVGNSDVIYSVWSGMTSPAFPSQTLNFSETNATDPLSAYVEPSGTVYKNYYMVTGQDNAVVGSTQGPMIGVILDSSGAYWTHGTGGNSAVTPPPTSCPSSYAYFLGGLWGIDYQGPLVHFDTGAKSDTEAQTMRIVAWWNSKVFQFDSQNHFMYAYVYFKKQSTGTLTFSYSIDEGTYTDVSIDMTAGTGTRVKSQEVLIGQVGSSIQFKFSNYNAGEAFEIYGIEYTRRPLTR